MKQSTNKYQESNELCLVGVYCQVENSPCRPVQQALGINRRKERVCPCRAPVLSSGHYLQAPATQVMQKINLMLNLQQNRKNALDKIPEMFVNCKQSSY